MDDDDAGDKYAYLLQPIKDLQKNFDIDIVSILEEYRQKVAEYTAQEKFEQENAHRFNFAEAAMIIQGSVGVFGKKVDHVHTQAINFFDMLKTNKEKKKKSAGNGEDDDDGFGGGDDEDSDPLGLMPMDPCNLHDMSRCKPANMSSLVMHNFHSHDAPSICIMPMSLMPLADYEKCNVPIYNSKNKSEVVGKKDDYKMNTGYMCKMGALLLDLLNEHLLKKFDESILVGPDDDGDQNEDSGRGSPVAMDLAQDVDLPLPGGDLPNCDPSQVSNIVEVNRRATAGITMDGLQARPSTVLLHAGPIPSQPVAEVDSFVGCAADDSFVDVPPPKKLESWELEAGVVEFDPTVKLVQDPFESVHWKHKPLKAINCTVNVQNLLKKRKLARSNASSREKTMETIEYVNENFYFRGKRQRAKRALGLGWEKNWDDDAFFPFILEQQKRREKQKREEQARKRTAKEPLAQQRLDDSDDDVGGGGFDDDEFIIAQPANPTQDHRFADIEDEEMNISINIPSLYLGQQPAAEKMADDVAPIGDVAGPTTSMSLADLLEFFMKQYWNAQAEATSRLAARVQEWDEKMQPLLEEEETRKEFDIHEYGGELLELFEKEQQDRSLPQLLNGKRDYEISRYFLSCLMMANTLNVEVINEQQNGPDPMKMMRVKLLKRDRHHEVFDRAGAL